MILAPDNEAGGQEGTQVGVWGVWGVWGGGKGDKLSDWLGRLGVSSVSPLRLTALALSLCLCLFISLSVSLSLSPSLHVSLYLSVRWPCQPCTYAV